MFKEIDLLKTIQKQKDLKNVLKVNLRKIERLQESLVKIFLMVIENMVTVVLNIMKNFGNQLFQILRVIGNFQLKTLY